MPDRPATAAGDRALALERMAEAVMARLAPLSFELAETPADRDAVLRMRYECVVGEGWARAEDQPDGRERDEYDDEATFVVCRDAGFIAGSMRLVAPSPGRPLPTERAYGIRARPPGRAVEVGRIVVAPSSRAGRSHLVLAGLGARGWLEACRWGYEGVVSTATAEVVDLYRALGLRVTVLGPARTHWGASRVPIRVDGDERSFDFVGRAGGPASPEEPGL